MQKSVKQTCNSGKYAHGFPGKWRLVVDEPAIHRQHCFILWDFKQCASSIWKAVKCAPKWPIDDDFYHWIISDHCIDWPPIFSCRLQHVPNINHVTPYQGCRSSGPKKAKPLRQEANRPRRGRCNCAHHEMMRKSFTWRWLVAICCQLDRPFSAFLSQKKGPPIHENSQLQAGLKIGDPMSQKVLASSSYVQHMFINMINMYVILLNYCYQIAIVVAF